MNAVAEDAARFPSEKEPESRLREIPYNYTSLADREIVIRLLGDPAGEIRDGGDAARDAKVGELLRAAAQAVQRFERQFADFAVKRKRAQRLLSKHTRPDNVRFDAF